MSLALPAPAPAAPAPARMPPTVMLDTVKVEPADPLAPSRAPKRP
jgi:hypothetical protein